MLPLLEFVWTDKFYTSPSGLHWKYVADRLQVRVTLLWNKDDGSHNQLAGVFHFANTGVDFEWLYMNIVKVLNSCILSPVNCIESIQLNWLPVTVTFMKQKWC